MKYRVVDAFTQQKFCGNSAAVCLLEAGFTDEELQGIAAEFNLSETAYLEALADGRWSLRWFTPAMEVNLCGHATLAAAHALWTEFGVNDEVLRFITRSGELTVTRNNDVMAMRFPLTMTSQVDAGGWAHSVVDSRLLRGAAEAGEDLLIELQSADAVQRFVPDLVSISSLKSRGLIVTAAADSASPIDFVSRFFAPNAGINEDPVTGSAHCALAHYWSLKTGKNTFSARQVSSRGGALDICIDGDVVVLSGYAVTTMKGELLI
ncbi:PhzF family phenazine biosynthesis protein [Zhongshania sp.]|jgi:PhzF family phenazine biosynthesis protein|uniref:PhzF family phenazine biosynthesis protein n=1 Tax=Zhongshania sp. TaxID=1971902 RepID=UPI0039E6A8A3